MNSQVSWNYLEVPTLASISPTELGGNIMMFQFNLTDSINYTITVDFSPQALGLSTLFTAKTVPRKAILFL